MSRLRTLTRITLGAGLCGLLLAGCNEPLRRADVLTRTAEPLAVSRNEALHDLDAAQVCCTSLRDLPYTPLPVDFSGNVVIDRSAPAFQFDSGKSFFRAFELPLDSRSFEIRLYSEAGKTVLAPSAMLLDSHFRVTRLLGREDFVYQAAAGLKGDSLDARLRIDRLYRDNPGNERYLILYTAEQDLAGQTTLEHPAKSFAKALGNQPPNIPDPVAQHSPAGVIKMVLIEDRLAGQQANTYVPPRSVGMEMGNRVPSLPEPAVLPETRAYYRQAIDAALATQDLDRALRLADEATRAGDDSARPYLLERIRVK